ncbi:MAG: DUF192 domain-containing protein [Myxococcota bacterium]
MAFRVTNQTQGKILADRVVEARSFLHRFLGLMGRAELPFGEGLHIVPCRSIHTFFMRVPIDAIFLDDSGRVVKTYPALPPWRLSGMYLRAHSVLELPSGTVAGSGTMEGDRLSFEPV